MIIYPRKDGGVCILTPVLSCGLTELEIAAKDVPTGRPYKIIAASDLLTDRYFRNAWEADFSAPDGHGADHGHKNVMRQARADRFRDLDIALQKAIETNDPTAIASIAAQKQQLRDVTAAPELNAATTPETVKAIWPEFLGSKP